MPRRLSIVARFDADSCRRIAHRSPAATVFFTDSTQQVLSAHNATDQYVSAERWHLAPAQLSEFVNTHGADLSYTSPAAFALSLWRKRCGGPEYRLQPGFDQDMSRAALYGGRCEVYEYLPVPVAHKYDFNACYPACALELRFPNPYSLRYARPPSEANIWMYEGVSHVTFSQSGSYPILPAHWGGRLLFPNADRLTGYYTHTELRYALHHFPTITLHAISKQYIALDTLPENPFSRFVDYCFQERERAADAPTRRLWKIIANALFGRLSVAAGARNLWEFRPTPLPDAAVLALPEEQFGHPSAFGYVCVGTPSHAPGRGIPLWPAMILAQARCQLHSLIDPDVVYVDTDCVFCKQARPLPTGAGLGAMKYAYGPFTPRGTQAYLFAEEMKLRGVSKARRDMADFLRAETTSERTRLPTGRTVPVQIPAQSAII